MSFQKLDIIKYRLEKSETTFNEALYLLESGFLAGSGNRPYYSCYYSVTSLLLLDDISIKTHNGVRTEFFKNYIKTEIFDRKLSQIYSSIMELRQDIDYKDMLQLDVNYLKDQALEVKYFNNRIVELINKHISIL